MYNHFLGVLVQYIIEMSIFPTSKNKFLVKIHCKYSIIQMYLQEAKKKFLIFYFNCK